MHISQLQESRFLKKEDCGKGIILTIHGESMENVAPNDQPEEIKCVIWFAESDKPMVLNTTNAKLIASCVGLEDTTQWVAHRVRVELFNDRTIIYRGKPTGGIRVREAEITSPQPKAPGQFGFESQAPQRPMPQSPGAFRSLRQPAPQPPPRRQATDIQPGDKNPFDE